MKKKMMMALALAGSLWLGGTAMAMDVCGFCNKRYAGKSGKHPSFRACQDTAY